MRYLKPVCEIGIGAVAAFPIKLHLVILSNYQRM